jgi:hypothetical protein
MTLADITGTKIWKICKLKIVELETNGKITNIRDVYRGINDFKKGCQPRTHILRN